MASCFDETSMSADGAEPKTLRRSLDGLDDGKGNGANQALTGRKASKENIEPIIIGNYKTMNYFSQAASDVTIYLNSEEDFNGESSSEVDMIDLTESLKQKPVNGYYHCEGSKGTKGMLDLKPIECLQIKDEVDTPEYINISKLQVPIQYFLRPADVNPSSNQNTSGLPFPQRKKLTMTRSIKKIDDEVIFVKEEKAQSNDPLGSSSLRTELKDKPRRNPKRQVQVLKASTDFALKPSDADIYYGLKKKSFKDYTTDASRQSICNTGAIFNPPAALTDDDIKEWPAEGMHEKPVFNVVTKKIEDADKPEPRKGPVKKKGTVKRAPRKRRAARKIRKPKKADTCETGGINEEFAALTHETLEKVLSYVLQVKKENKITERGEGPEDERNEHEIREDEMATSAEDMNDKRKENLMHVTQLLSDSCLLYSLANGACHSDVARYLDNYKKDHPEEN